MAFKPILGAVCAIFLYLVCIAIFGLRIAGKAELGRRIGTVEFILFIPLIYLLVRVAQTGRPALYVIQIGLMLAFLVAELLLDYVFKVNFRQNLRAVIA